MASGPDAPMDLREVTRAVVEFALGASTEISPHDEKLLPELAEHLRPGMTVYVAHTPRSSLEDVVRVASKLQAMGFTASPHIVARRLPSERALKSALRTLRDSRVEQALLVAGDLDPPAGPFTSTIDVIDTGLVQEADFRRLGVAGHPEGHPVIRPETQLAALRRKQQFAERAGIALHIVTQFGFNPEAVFAWDQHLETEGIRLPVHVGIAGPTALGKLMKFAIQCGIGSSMHTLVKHKNAMARLIHAPSGPDEMLLGLVKGRAMYPGSRLVQPHLYTLGGALAAARWLQAVMDGSFDLQSDGKNFNIAT
ncbi:MAG: hypothetical protein HIU85_16000 [Proteobacteria bacterium]|nr:hypothetical protein [Pseudomonadota bacterium]